MRINKAAGSKRREARVVHGQLGVEERFRVKSPCCWVNWRRALTEGAVVFHTRLDDETVMRLRVNNATFDGYSLVDTVGGHGLPQRIAFVNHPVRLGRPE